MTKRAIRLALCTIALIATGLGFVAWFVFSGGQSAPPAVPQDPGASSRFLQLNPGVNCPDGRNAVGAPIDTLEACPNGSAHLRINPDGSIEVLSVTSGQFVQADVPEAGQCSTEQPPAQGWLICSRVTEVRTAIGDDGQPVTIREASTSLSYRYASDVTPFMHYVTGENGTWEAAVNLNDVAFQHGQVSQVLMTWVDASQPRAVDAPVPQGFNWTSAEKRYNWPG